MTIRIEDEAEEAFLEFKAARPDAGPDIYTRPAFLAAYVAGYEVAADKFYGTHGR